MSYIYHKCRNCGIRLVTQMEINGYGDYCTDCHRKNIGMVNTVSFVSIVIVVLVLAQLF